MSEHTLFRGGTHAQVVKIGDTVRRPRGPHSAFMQRTLDQLAVAGVAAPRFLAVDASGRDMLTFIEGTVLHEPVDFSDAQLSQAITLVRQMHDATAGSPLAGTAEVVCHNDLAPWNLVMQGDVPIAFIDFDAAAPGSRVDDVAYFAWTFLKLGGSAPVTEQRRRLQLVCSRYGIDADENATSAIARQQRRILEFRERQAATANDANRRAFATQRAQRIREDMACLAANGDLLRSLVPVRKLGSCRVSGDAAAK